MSHLRSLGPYDRNGFKPGREGCRRHYLFTGEPGR